MKGIPLIDGELVQGYNRNVLELEVASMSRVVRTLFFCIFSIAIAAIIPSVFAQQAQDPGAPPAPQKLDKETKRKMKRTLKELDSAYRQWLTEDVTYIISPEERNSFLQLDTNEEREQFIEAFWLRRSSNPDLPENDFKEEHYRRIAYANEHFASGIPGWKTDRGRMYIMWGPADEVETHPTGGTYERPMEEGGGSTTTYPFETWRWRYLEGIGENIILEFVDPSGSGEYHLTMDPSEKDALLHVPGAGLSLMEEMGMASKTDRFTRSDGTNLPTALGGTPASMNEFSRLELYAKVNKPPEVKFKDLEAVVTSRIVRDQLHFNWRTDYLKVTNDTVLVPVTVQVPNSQLSFQAKDGIHSATMNIFIRVSTLTGRVVQTLEDPVSRDFPDSLYQQSLKLQSIYQKAVPLRPGLYRLDLVIKDVQSGNIGVVNSRLQVPRYEDDKLETSSLILADGNKLEHVPSKQIGTGQFVLGSTKVVPRLEADFTTAERLGIYMQVYNLKPDDKTHKSSATFQYTVKKGQERVMQFKETSAEMKQTGDQVTIERLLPLATLSPGKYSLEVNATDTLSNQTISRSAEFTVKAPAETKTAANAAPGR
jgi:GWxTD domain-containing protein